MKTHLTFAIAMGCAALLTACGVEERASTTSAKADRHSPRTLLLVAGGHKSCKTDANGNASPYGLDMVTSGQVRSAADQLQGPITTVFACYGTSDPIRYIVDDVVADAYATGSSTDSAELTAEDPGELAAAVDAVMAEKHAEQLLFIGHSYGGWLAMKVALAMSRAPDQLVTIDPISRYNCWWTWPLGCFGAPSDIGADERAYLRDGTSQWLNYYETGRWWLHSGEIEEADENSWLDDYHTTIDVDDSIWQRLRSDLAARR